MPLDLIGDISLILSVVCFFLLFVGLPLVRGINSKKNLMRHGYLTIVALVLQTILVLAVMIPAFLTSFDDVLALSPAYAANTWLHVGLGVLAEVAGFFLVAVWLVYSVSRMRCVTAKKYMTPTMVIWLIAVVTGALIHLLEML
ncbi:MAG: hypothetical protein ACE14S_08980 [Candidatus Bathyarchaeia archaeon]